MSVKRRSFWMMLLLSFVTCGFYGLYWWFCYIEDMNRICEGKSSEKPSPNYFIVLILTLITCGIYSFVWMYKQGNRLADAAESYGIRNQTTGSSLLMWQLFGALLCGLGPWIALSTWIDLFNKVADAYNAQLPGGGNPDGGNPGGGTPGGSPAPDGVAAIAQKMEQGAGNIAGKLQGAKGLSDIKKIVSDKVPVLQKNNASYRNLITSKTRSMAPGNVRSANTSELWHPEAPVIVTKVQIAEMGQEGDAELFIGFQNMAEKPIAAIYLDVVCYNVLKEQIGVLTDLCYIDLNVGFGQIYESPAPILLPDKSIRKCDIIVRHVVYADESIWSYEGNETFEPIEEQGTLNLPDGLNDEFKRQMKTVVSDVNYGYMPEDRGAYWLCSCGQLNPSGTGRCIACGAELSFELNLLDLGYLADQRDIYMEEERKARAEAERLEAERKAQEEALKAQRIAERNQKLEEAQEKAKKAFGAVKSKGSEKLKGVAILPKSNSSRPEGGDGVCPKCGKPYRAGDKFCMGCGMKIVQPAPQTPSQAPSQTPSQPSVAKMVPSVKICGKCGMKNDEDSAFCMGCGSPLNQQEKQAPGVDLSKPSPASNPVVSPVASPVSSPVSTQPEEDQDELKTLVLTPEMAAQMAAAYQKPEDTSQPAGPAVQNGKVICPACGYENEPGEMFCMGCGNRIDE